VNREFRTKAKGSKSFWIQGYSVSTVGLDDKKVREYIRDQEKLDKDAKWNSISMRLVASFRGHPEATRHVG